MNLKVTADDKFVFVNCECIKGYAYKIGAYGVIAPIPNRFECLLPQNYPA